MKKWLPAFLFLSLSGCNDALAANQSTMFTRLMITFIVLNLVLK